MMQNVVINFRLPLLHQIFSETLGGALFDVYLIVYKNPISSGGGSKAERAGERGKKDHLAELGGGTSVAAAELH
jgi:hypothetical protein